MAKWNSPFLIVSAILLLVLGISAGQSVPQAPPAPACAWDGTGTRSTCKFKDALAGTPTSVAGNRVILFDRTVGGGHPDSRKLLRETVERLANRYGFTATVTQDPAVFTAANLADAKVVILAHGDGDVVPAGVHRSNLEDFQQVSGWGVLWIHAACAFITAGWPFAQESCVQLYHHQNWSGTRRRLFIDSGTATQPGHGRKHPDSEFLLRQLPGWFSHARELSDEWHCFRAPARNTAGVNVLFGYDRLSGPASANCIDGTVISESASQNHNLVWTHRMGQGIALVNHLGNDQEAYAPTAILGDSLLWRFIRYAAKDWCVGGSGEPGCDVPTAARARETVPEIRPLGRGGLLAWPLPEAGRCEVSLRDFGGKRVFSGSAQGPGTLEIPGLRRGRYFLVLTGKGSSRTHRIMVY